MFRQRKSALIRQHMTIMRIKLCIGVVLLFICCCRQEKDHIKQISFSNSRDIKISLTDLASDLDYIKISNTIPIQHLLSIEYFDNSFFISCYPKTILRLNKEGEIINQICKIGRGPTEIQNLMSFTIDQYNKNVIVLSRPHKLKFYSFSGEYIKTIDVEHIYNFFEVYVFAQNQILLVKGNPYLNSKYNWVKIDMEGTIIDYKLNSIKFPLKSYLGIIPPVIIFKKDNCFYYYETFNDTIFKINEKGYSTEYLFVRDQYRLTPEVFFNNAHIWMKNLKKGIKPPQLLIMDNFFMINNQLWINYAFQRDNQIAYLDNKTNIIYKIVNSDNTIGIINDFDGGLPFIPKWKLIKDGYSYLVYGIDAFKLKEHVASKAFKNSKPKYPEKKKELEKLANSLDENDNPVLMLVRLKE